MRYYLVNRERNQPALTGFHLAVSIGNPSTLAGYQRKVTCSELVVVVVVVVVVFMKKSVTTYV